MFGLSARAVGFYAALAYPFALLCAIPYFTDLVKLDPVAERGRLRTAQVLVALAPIHILFPITALGIVLDTQRVAADAATNEHQRRRALALAMVGIVVSLASFVVLTRDR